MKLKLEKKDNYSKMVKEMYLPKTSVRKKMELEQLMANLPENRRKNNIRRSLDHVENSEGALHSPKQKKDLKYERPWRNPPSLKRVGPAKAKSNTEDVNSMIGNQNHLYSEDNTAYTQKRIDYLTEMRNKRQLELPSNNVNSTLDSVLNNSRLNEYEKLEAVKRKASQIENQAKKKEMLIQVSSNQSKAVQETIAINDMYIEAIQAKLKILDSI